MLKLPTSVAETETSSQFYETIASAVTRQEEKNNQDLELDLKGG